MGEDPDIERIMIYLLCAKEFGWTPEETDKVDVFIIQGMMCALEEINRKEKYEIEKSKWQK
jgi:hypothetical protein